MSHRYPVLVRIFIISEKTLRKLFLLLKVCFSAFWLAVLKREALYLLDERYYNNAKMYFDEEYNKRGWFYWEEKVIKRWFQQCKSLLVAGAGGGREVLELRRLGHEVDGFECHHGLAEFANELLKKEGFTPNVKIAPRDKYLMTNKIYDGIIVGWSVYMRIKGRKERQRP